MATPLQVFNDFMANTSPLYITGPEVVLNEAQRRTYLLKKFLKGRAPEEVLQSGSEIRDTVIFDEQNTMQQYLPNDTFTWRNPQVTSEHKGYWRFGVDHKSWTDQEITLNQPRGLTKAERIVRYKDVGRIKEQRLMTSLLNGMEDRLLQSPSASGMFAAMEGANGREVLSLPAMISELPTHLPPGVAAGNTVQGFDPATVTGWRNNVVFYDRLKPVKAIDGSPASARYNPRPTTVDMSAWHADNPYKAWGAGQTVFNLIEAFDEMYLLCRYETPPFAKEYMESLLAQRQMILTSRKGVNLAKSLLRELNQSLISPSDPAYNSPVYSGIPIEPIEGLTTGALYAAATSATTDSLASQASLDPGTLPQENVATEEGSTAILQGPRYWWINAEYLKPVFHSERYLMTHDVMRHPNQPFTWVQPTDTWWNLWLISRRRMGIVVPCPSA